MGLPPYVAKLRERVGHDLLLLPSVTAVVVNADGEVLLGRRVDTGAWALISGILEPDEQPAAGIIREVLEETGVRVLPERIVGVYLSPQLHYPNGDVAQYVTTVFFCHVLDGTPCVNDDESLEVGYFPRHRWPRLSSGQSRQLEDAFSGSQSAAFSTSAGG